MYKLKKIIKKTNIFPTKTTATSTI